MKQVEQLNDLVQELTPSDRLPVNGHRRSATARLVAGPDGNDPRNSWRAKLLDPALRGRPDFRQVINRALQKSKDDYKTTYLNLHNKARLGINEDEKKKNLLKDARLDSSRSWLPGSHSSRIRR